jgi:hypothetical protein
MAAGTDVFDMVGLLSARAQAQSFERKSCVSQLKWLSGDWYYQNEDQSLVIEAQFSLPRGGFLLGFLRQTEKNEVSFFEFQKFEDSGESLVLFPFPFGNPGISFPLKEMRVSSEAAEVAENCNDGGRFVVFENAAHDFPRVIRYSLDKGNELKIEVWGIQNNNPVKHTMVLRKVKGN